MGRSLHVRPLVRLRKLILEVDLRVVNDAAAAASDQAATVEVAVTAATPVNQNDCRRKIGNRHWDTLGDEAASVCQITFLALEATEAPKRLRLGALVAIPSARKQHAVTDSGRLVLGH